MSDLFVAPHGERTGQVLGDGREEVRALVAEVVAGLQHRHQPGEGNAMYVL